LWLALHESLKKISQQGGTLLILRQEGRGIGLLNKLKRMPARSGA